MTLQEKLDGIRAAFESNAPAQTLEIMHRATRDLEQSGAADQAVAEGAAAPAFSLPGAKGTSLKSADLLNAGPLVVTFFRGFW